MEIQNNAPEKKCCGVLFHEHKHMALRILILLAMVAFVFFLGIKVGEFRNEGFNGEGFRGGEFRQGQMMGRQSYGFGNQNQSLMLLGAYRQGYRDCMNDAPADDQGGYAAPQGQAAN